MNSVLGVDIAFHHSHDQDPSEWYFETINLYKSYDCNKVVNTLEDPISSIRLRTSWTDFNAIPQAIAFFRGGSCNRFTAQFIIFYYNVLQVDQIFYLAELPDERIGTFTKYQVIQEGSPTWLHLLGSFSKKYQHLREGDVVYNTGIGWQNITNALEILSIPPNHTLKPTALDWYNKNIGLRNQESDVQQLKDFLEGYEFKYKSNPFHGPMFSGEEEPKSRATRDDMGLIPGVSLFKEFRTRNPPLLTDSGSNRSRLPNLAVPKVYNPSIFPPGRRFLHGVSDSDGSFSVSQPNPAIGDVNIPNSPERRPQEITQEDDLIPDELGAGENIGFRRFHRPGFSTLGFATSLSGSDSMSKPEFESNFWLPSRADSNFEPLLQGLGSKKDGQLPLISGADPEEVFEDSLEEYSGSVDADIWDSEKIVTEYHSFDDRGI
ncbi:hypothetical protein TWF694_008985 [Orbilia ellipsospora]|uniref:Uncharacterized protein n=1 Tax=Orbilia ellipsospora TaxID=2528407 RepID=A0AAV9XGA4_9PEZI